MRIVKSNKSIKDTEKVCATSGSKVIYDKDGVTVTVTDKYNASSIEADDVIAVIENNADKDYRVNELDLVVPANEKFEIKSDEDGYEIINYYRYINVKPLTKDQVKDLWDKEALFIIWGDGSDSLCQENDYTLDEILKYMDEGCEVFRDEDPDIIDACGDIKASSKVTSNSRLEATEPTVDNVLDMIEKKEIIIRNNVPYWKKTKKVVSKKFRDCIYDTQYAHWINEWDCEQAEQLGDKAYTEYGEIFGMRIKATKKLSANDQALQHIKAAIDVLGKSGQKDDVTKDSIANLSVVLFDIKASSGSCKYSKAECINAIKDQYGYTNKEAEQYYKEADCKTLEALVEGFKSNAKKTFYDD